MVRCTNCGFDRVPPGAAQCPNCGWPVQAQSNRLQTTGTSGASQAALVSARLPGPCLIAEDGSMYPLNASLNTLGRSPGDNTIILADSNVSGRHAQIELSGGDYVLTDRQSRNHTFVNGRMLSTPWRLQAGDVITLGTLNLRFADSPSTALSHSGGMGTMPPQIGGPGFGAVSATPSLPWRKWRPLPQAEGLVRTKEGPFAGDKGGRAGKAVMAALLGVFVSPALAIIPLASSKQDITYWILRVEDKDRPGRQMSIVIRGELMGSIAIGDQIAVWGKVVQGNIVMDKAYNYTTDAYMQPKN